MYKDQHKNKLYSPYSHLKLFNILQYLLPVSFLSVFFENHRGLVCIYALGKNKTKQKKTDEQPPQKKILKCINSLKKKGEKRKIVYAVYNTCDSFDCPTAASFSSFPLQKLNNALESDENPSNITYISRPYASVSHLMGPPDTCFLH